MGTLLIVDIHSSLQLLDPGCELRLSESLLTSPGLASAEARAEAQLPC